MILRRTSSHRPGWLLCLALAAAGAPSLASAASDETEPTPRPVALEVVSRVGGPDSDTLEDEVRGQIARQLGRYEVAVASGSPTRLTVALQWRDDARTTYAVSVVLAQAGSVVAQDQRFCELCGTTELFESISFAVATVMAAKRRTPTPPAPKAPAPPPTPATDVEVDAPRPRALNTLGFTGIGLAGVGVAALSTGGALWAKGDTTRVDPQDATLLRRRNYRPPGIALVAGGASVAAAGVVMIAVDATRQRRRRRWTLAPQLGVRSAGITLRGRF